MDDIITNDQGCPCTNDCCNDPDIHYDSEGDTQCYTCITVCLCNN
jgi:hypothetical protein